MARYVSIWFPYLLPEYSVRKTPSLGTEVFVLTSSQRGRIVIDSVSAKARDKNIYPGMVLADAQAIFPQLRAFPLIPHQAGKLLKALALWCIAYTPFSAIDPPDGLVLNCSGCTHLWGGELPYMQTIATRLKAYGYTVQIAMADTMGAAWALARYGNGDIIAVPPGKPREALSALPAAALRIDSAVLAKLQKLGLTSVGSFIDLPASVLRRRFGPSLPLRIAQCTGQETEAITPVKPIEPYQERLCSIEPIVNAVGISIALKQLLGQLCRRFQSDGRGLRQAAFRGYRTDGEVRQIQIGTSQPSVNPEHLFKLFEHKIATLEPALGFEVFVLEAPKTEILTDEQHSIWAASGQDDKKVAELLDRIVSRIGERGVARYLPAQHYWPERSVKEAAPLWEKPAFEWRTDQPRPIHLLVRPEIIEVTAVLPDYPPLLFLHKGKRYDIQRSDGPERIEQEWWLEKGAYRDYYTVEDLCGARYWLFRQGPYDDKPKWFLHGFFA